MLTLILIDVQYLQKAIFGFEKGMNCQNHSSVVSLHPIKKLPSNKIYNSPTPHCWGNLPPPLVSYRYLENPR